MYMSRFILYLIFNIVFRYIVYKAVSIATMKITSEEAKAASCQ